MLNFNVVTTSGDRGAQHRAIDIAQKLADAAIWDGSTPLFIPDPYNAQRKAQYIGMDALIPNVDYVFHAAATPKTPMPQEAQTVEEKVVQLRNEGWRLLTTADGGCFFMHRSGNAVTCLGGGFARYEDAVNQTYASETRRYVWHMYIVEREAYA